MQRILIVDAIKPSLVMSSEIFKDRIPGVSIYVATSGSQAMEMISSVKPDMCLVDFDLPDVDGPALILELRKSYHGPILMTAYPDENVAQAVSEDLFSYCDSSDWLPKPVKVDILASKIDKFLTRGYRILKRFETQLPALVIAKATGPGKRAPKVEGVVRDIGIGGVQIELDSLVRFKKKQEVTLSISFPEHKPTKGKGSIEIKAAKPAAKVKGSKKATSSKPKKATIKYVEAKLKGNVVWFNKDKKVGVQFAKLTDAQTKNLESYLKRDSVLSQEKI